MDHATLVFADASPPTSELLVTRFPVLLAVKRMALAILTAHVPAAKDGSESHASSQPAPWPQSPPRGV